jgi:hypothetical protein
MFIKKIIAILGSFSVLGVISPVWGTPVGTHVRWVKQLDKPRLYLVQFTVVYSQGIPGDEIVTHEFVDYTYRVYCPTAMVRNVTNGKWGEAHLAWNDNSAGMGALNQIIYQVCPEHY